MKNCLVTGASGFIGRKLCETLRDQGLYVRALMRSEISGEWNESFSMDLASEEVPEKILDGIDTVFHLAGKAHALAETKQDENEYFLINTLATQKLLEACKETGVGTFVYFSSVKAVGDVDGMMDESVSIEADTPYGRSKRAAEKLVLEGSYVPHPVVIRPCMVYGNTDKGNLPKMIRAIAAGKFPPLPEMKNRRSMVHVDDVVEAAIMAAENPSAAGNIYIVTDGNDYSTRQMYEWICEALNRPAPSWVLPQALLKLMAMTGDIIGSVRGSRFIFDSDALEKLIGSARYSSGKIERELGFRAGRNLKEALPEIVSFLGKVR